MNLWLLDLLACPSCRKGALTLEPEQTEDGRILTGLLRCQCASTYTIVRGICRMLPPADAGTFDRQTSDRFEYQWRTWGRGKVIFGKDIDQARECFRQFSHPRIRANYLEGKLALDAGCGHGRFAGLLAEHGARAVGLDLCEGVEIARERTAGMRDVSIVQGDILHLPFRDEAFDYVWSNGVLHHTPDTRIAFQSLSRATKPGGFLDIWVYPRGGATWEILHRCLRAVTTRLPAPFLHALCYIPVPLLSLVRTYSDTRWPKNTWRECAQVTYDWFSPRYQWHHTAEDVRRWYEEAGFEEIQEVGVPTGLAGKKKTRGTPSS
ncbi:MAG: methyltransferase domain-containing protein [Planctomycetes bacterium]|nr:methyltransferase domain-containing protein [Planctomycetota bacterium]